jgi:two-component system OmpR family response regulator
MRVLVVEDDVKVAAAVKRGLQAEGFGVDVAHNGIDGLWMATEHDYDVIVLDVMLPGKNGYVLCAELRRADDWTPVLMLTAKDGELDEAEGLDTGADDYLTKPFSFVVLTSRVRALARRASRRTPQPVAVGDLHVDAVRGRCRRGRTEIALTAREFAVLEYLVRRAGEVVPKRAILGGVWDDDFDGDPNIVEVYIRHLRRKVDEPFGLHTIETIRGAGYRLAPNGR